MKFTCSIISFMAIFVIVSADGGPYVPRSFYILNEDGSTSDVSYLNSPTLLHRLRRSPFPQGVAASSSSSSSSSSNGGPTYFSQQSSTYGGGLDSRFGGSSGTGHYVSTSGVVDPNGQVYYNTQTGRI